MRARTAMVVLWLTSAAACAVDPLDLEGRECPCVTGWTCDTTTNQCVVTVVVDGSMSGRDGGGGRDGGTSLDGDLPSDDGGAFVVEDGGGVDGGTASDGGTTPTSNCDVRFAGRLFCDGFEDGTTDKWDGTDTDSPGGGITVVSDRVYMGTHALRVEAAVSSAENLLYKEVFSTASPPDQWFRGYYYFDGMQSVPTEFHAITESSNTYNFVAEIAPPTFNFHAHSVWGGLSTATTSPIPTDRWVCVEFHLHTSAATGSLELFVDDAVIAASLGFDSTTPRGLAVITAGIIWKNYADPARVIWIDELVADTARIGCD